jgi:hypothetical protein
MAAPMRHLDSAIETILPWTAFIQMSRYRPGKGQSCLNNSQVAVEVAGQTSSTRNSLQSKRSDSWRFQASWRQFQKHRDRGIR